MRPARVPRHTAPVGTRPASGVPRAAPAHPVLARLCCLGAILLASCAGATASADGGGERLRVLLQDYSAGQHFELASESHTDRVAYYSEVRSEAARKIQTDEVLALLVDELERQGFAEHAQAGRAPTRAGSAVTRALEIEDGDTTRHWLIGNGSPLEERKAFNECLAQFLDLYNISASFQTIDNPRGPEFFEQEQSGRPPAADER